MAVELKPCPWCGDSLVAGRVVEGDTFRWRRVQGCCADGPEVRHDTLADDKAAAEADSQRRAIEAWNTRATHPPAVGVDVTDEMVESYLEAQRVYVMAEDARWGRQIGGGSHRDAIRDACRAGLTAALRTGGGES